MHGKLAADVEKRMDKEILIQTDGLLTVRVNQFKERWSVMSWLYLLLAIGLEVTGTILLKMADGLSNLKYIVGMLIAYVTSLLFLSLALKKIDIGVAYAVWSGIGITAIEVTGVLFFKENMTIPKIIFITLILVGTIGLNVYRTA